MKELSIEEKAKAYDKVREKIAIRFGSNVADEIFSQFEMSEDEKVRKNIIIALKSQKDELEDFYKSHNTSESELVTWIEKQGEQESLCDKCRKEHPSHSCQDITALGRCAVEHGQKPADNVESSAFKDKLLELFQKFRYIKEGVPTNGDIIDYVDAHIQELFDAVNEQKSINTVEPKFKVGDLIANDYCMGKVIEITDDTYLLDSGQGIPFSCEHNAHLWSIKDTKDGDVLHSPSHRLIWIYKDNEHYHACVNMNYVTENVATDGLISIPNDACPATKDERTILFARMKEAGYEWDAEKRELKKIPNALEECEIEHIEDGKYYYCIKDYYSGGCKRASKGEVVQALRGMSMMALGAEANKYFIPVKCIVDVKSVWSEEDERKISDVIVALSEYANGNIPYILPSILLEDVDWLKSLKERVQSLSQPKEWSEEDGRKINRIYSILGQAADTHAFSTTCRLISDKECIELQDFLKSLRPQNNYNPYKEVVESIAEMCKHYDKASHSGLRDFYDNVKVKCRDAKEYDSLFPQNTWKPSDEQIKVKGFVAVDNCGDKTIYNPTGRRVAFFPKKPVRDLLTDNHYWAAHISPYDVIHLGYEYFPKLKWEDEPIEVEITINKD